MSRARIVRRTGVVLAAAASLFVTSLPAVPALASVGTTVRIEKTCTTGPSVSVSSAPDGAVRGFVGTGCGNDVIDYVSDLIVPGGWKSVASPYAGVVLATAQDAATTYLLYRAADGVRVATVSHAGVFAKGSLLSAAVGGGFEGSLAARGGRWYAVWTEPDGSGGIGLHAAGSPGYGLPAKERILPAGAGVEDTAPSLQAAASGNGYVLAFSRHTATGYQLMLAHGLRTWVGRAIDSGASDPQPSLLRSGAFSFLGWIHGTSVRLATTAGHLGHIVALYQVPVPQAPGMAVVTDPRLAVGCGRLFVGYQADTASAGTVYVNTLLSHAWVRHVVSTSRAAAPVLAGIAAHCEAGAVVWTSAASVYGVMVA